MTNETTYLENLLNNRKVVRSYQKASFDKNSLEDIAKYAVKIPTAGFSRGIEIPVSYTHLTLPTKQMV